MKRSTGAGNHRAFLGWLSGALVLLLLACSESTTATSYQVGEPPVVTSTALRPTVEQAQVDVYLNAIAAEEERQAIDATLTAVYAAQTATAVALQRTATAESVQATRTADVQRATATAQARATATAQAAAYAHATATAVHDHATATAQLAATRHAWTATAVAATARAEQAHATATAAAARSREAERAALAQERLRREQMETQRQRLIYPLRAYGPWVIGLFVLGLLVWGGYRAIRALEMRLRAIHRDARGDAPLMIFQQGGRIVAYDPDRAFGPATVFDAEVTQPQLTEPAAQERTTARDQTIDLTSRGVPQERRRSRRVSQTQGRRLLERASRPRSGEPGEVQVVPPTRVRPWLREVRPQALRHALTVEGEVLDDTQT
jgi:hypothetical protein